MLICHGHEYIMQETKWRFLKKFLRQDRSGNMIAQRLLRFTYFLVHGTVSFKSSVKPYSANYSQKKDSRFNIAETSLLGAAKTPKMESICFCILSMFPGPHRLLYLLRVHAVGAAAMQVK